MPSRARRSVGEGSTTEHTEDTDMKTIEVKIKVRFASATYYARIKPSSRLGLPQAVQASCTSGPLYAAKRVAAKVLRCEERDIQLRTVSACQWTETFNLEPSPMTKTEALYRICTQVAAVLDSCESNAMPMTKDEHVAMKRLRQAHRKIAPWATTRMKMLMEKRADKARVWRKEPPDQPGLWRIRGENFGPITIEVETPILQPGVVTMDVAGHETVVRDPEWSWIGEKVP